MHGLDGSDDDDDDYYDAFAINLCICMYFYVCMYMNFTNHTKFDKFGQVSNIEKLQGILGKYFQHIMLTTDSDNEPGVLSDTMYAAIPYENPGKQTMLHT